MHGGSCGRNRVCDDGHSQRVCVCVGGVHVAVCVCVLQYSRYFLVLSTSFPRRECLTN